MDGLYGDDAENVKGLAPTDFSEKSNVSAASSSPLRLVNSSAAITAPNKSSTLIQSLLVPPSISGSHCMKSVRSFATTGRLAPPSTGSTKITADSHDPHVTPANFRQAELRLNQRFRKDDGVCYINNLADELLLQIFQWIPKRFLCNCALVCKRWHRMSVDDSHWTFIDLGIRKVHIQTVHALIDRGLVVLRLARSELLDSPKNFCFDTSIIPSLDPCSLEYLDLSMAVVSNPNIVRDLVGRCTNLVGLSLEHLELNQECAEMIGENEELQYLNMPMCRGLDGECMKLILGGAISLAELNIAWCKFSREDVKTVVDYLPSSLLRLNFSGCRNKTMLDEDVAALCLRCDELHELDLSDCTDITDEALTSAYALDNIRVLHFSRCYGIDPNAFADLQDLMELNLFGTLNEAGERSLRSSLDSVELNVSRFSTVARPTTGFRRTRIWEMQTRDES